MPYFAVEFDSNQGPQLRHFTLDADRPLRPQIIQVLEELRLANLILTGSPGDELAVSWDRRELDLSQTFETLGVTVDRPLVLHMRPRPIAAVAAPPPKPEIKWRSILLPPIEGAIGAMLAWFLSYTQTDLLRPLETANQVDLLVALMLTGMIGLALVVGLLWRRDASVRTTWPSLLLAPLAGTGIALGIVIAQQSTSVGTFLVARVVAWVVALVALSLVITAPHRSLPSSRWQSACLWGAVTGAFAAVIQSLPGPSLVLQAVAFLIGGLGVGFAALGYPNWQASPSLAGESTP